MLGRGVLTNTAVQALLASEALIVLYMLLRRTLASSSTHMFDAVSDIHRSCLSAASGCSLVSSD